MESPTEPGRLTIIGTGHVLDIGATVQGAIEALRPQVVFVELDKGRLHALFARRAGHAPPPGGNWFHRRLQSFQEGLAASYGTQAGDEMLAAVDGARLVGAQIALIDRPVETTLRRALKQLTWRERLRAFGMTIEGGFKSLLPGRSTRDIVDEELAKYSQDPEAALDELGKGFPTIRRVLIDERDTWMANHIKRALDEGRDGVAVVGDGHVPGMLRELSSYDVTAYRLPAVRAGELPKPDLDHGTSMSFGFDIE